MSTPFQPTVWNWMSAFASRAYELRLVAPGEFEVVEIPADDPVRQCTEREASAADAAEAARAETADT